MSNKWPHGPKSNVPYIQKHPFKLKFWGYITDLVWKTLQYVKSQRAVQTVIHFRPREPRKLRLLSIKLFREYFFFAVLMTVWDCKMVVKKFCCLEMGLKFWFFDPWVLNQLNTFLLRHFDFKIISVLPPFLKVNYQCMMFSQGCSHNTFKGLITRACRRFWVFWHTESVCHIIAGTHSMCSLF